MSWGVAHPALPACPRGSSGGISCLQARLAKPEVAVLDGGVSNVSGHLLLLILELAEMMRKCHRQR